MQVTIAECKSKRDNACVRVWGGGDRKGGRIAIVPNPALNLALELLTRPQSSYMQGKRKRSTKEGMKETG
jgi:hypothetical protein